MSDAAFALLVAAGAGEQPHTGRTLLDHLAGTREILRSWPVRPVLCDAGLFHSVYGTMRHPAALFGPDGRARVRAVIGAEAEEIAHAFGVHNPRAFDVNLLRDDGFGIVDVPAGCWRPITRERMTDLFALTVANWADQVPHLDPDARFPARWLEPAGRLLPPAALHPPGRAS